MKFRVMGVDGLIRPHDRDYMLDQNVWFILSTKTKYFSVLLRCYLEDKTKFEETAYLKADTLDALHIICLLTS